MKRWLWMVLVMLCAGNAFGALPSVPSDVSPVRVERYDDAANFYIWMDSNYLYVHIDPITVPFFTSAFDWIAIQDGVQYDLVPVDASDDHISGDQFVPVTGYLKPTKTGLKKATHVTVIYQGASGGDVWFEVYPPGQSPPPTNPVPTEGIWKSGDGVLNMYLQKYQTGSCILVVTMGDGVLTGFLDSDYTDGISATDVYGQGYTLTLTLTDASHGTLTVGLPGWGTVTTPVALNFGAE